MQANTELALGSGGFTVGGNPPNLGLFNNSNVAADWQYGPGSTAETYNGYHGHAPLGIGGISNRGGLNGTGLESRAPLPNPNAPTCTVVGTPGTTHVKYAVQGQDYNGGVTLVSSDCSLTTAPNTLSGTNYVQVQWGSGQNYDGVQYWYVVKNDNTAVLSNGTPYTAYASGVWTLLDQGQYTFTSYTAPSRNSTGDVTVTSGQIANPVQSPGAACFGEGGVIYSSDTNTCPTPTATATATATPTPTRTPTATPT